MTTTDLGSTLVTDNEIDRVSIQGRDAFYEGLHRRENPYHGKIRRPAWFSGYDAERNDGMTAKIAQRRFNRAAYGV